MLYRILTESVWAVKIIYLEEVNSTQSYLIDALADKKLRVPVAVSADMQYDGKGSRGSNWIGGRGNLFLSFALPLAMLPQDLKIESSSIYLSYILKEVFEELGSDVWLKWPNDFYLNNKKIGGTIVWLREGMLICGIGVNLLYAPEGFDILDIQCDKSDIINLYFSKLEKKLSWKYIFSKYRLEFDKSKIYFSHFKDNLVSLKDASLLDDGSVLCEGERMFSIR